MSEETVDTIATQMLKFILEQAPMFMLVIIALLIVLGVIYTLVKLGLVSTKPESVEPKVVSPQEDFDKHLPRWTAEAKLAHDWLVNYKNTHFKDEK